MVTCRIRKCQGSPGLFSVVLFFFCTGPDILLIQGIRQIFKPVFEITVRVPLRVHRIPTVIVTAPDTPPRVSLTAPAV
jgi:hypothetical protein